jgi:methionyl-tRNA formyltransferase
MNESDVKKYALSQHLTILQPEKMKAAEFVEQYRSLQIDVAVVVAFRMMPEIIWSMPTHGTFNLHGSLLPNYRGAAPINWALIHGEKETGVTTFFINSEIDKGDLIYQSKIDIQKEDNFGTLYSKLKVIGADLVLKTIEDLEKGIVNTFPQQFSTNDKPAPKIDKEILHIHNFESCTNIENLVRGLIPVYKPYFTYKDKKYIIKNGFAENTSTTNSSELITTDEKTFLKLNCNDGFFHITAIQPEGKKEMDIVSFFNGNKI